MSHLRMSGVRHVNASCHTCKRFMSHAHSLSRFLSHTHSSATLPLSLFLHTSAPHPFHGCNLSNFLGLNLITPRVPQRSICTSMCSSICAFKYSNTISVECASQNHTSANVYTVYGVCACKQLA